ncbi:MAG: hypothetical protein IJ666_04550 [Ruminococcus sp.]|nr:hypothetical protein [Ruminococcus sp.]
MKYSKKYNYRINCGIWQNFDSFPMINGQALGDVSGMRYGLCPMSFNGCEVISVYNTLVYLGKPVPIQDIALYMERYRSLMGIFGCFPFGVGKALDYFGTVSTGTRNIKYIENADKFILCFWTGRKFLSSIHTVFCAKSGNGIRVYNRYNNCPTVRLYPDIKSVIGKGKIIILYIINSA